MREVFESLTGAQQGASTAASPLDSAKAKARRSCTSPPPSMLDIHAYGLPCANSAAKPVAKKAATERPLLDMFTRQRREMTDTAEVSAKIPKIEEGSSVSSAQTAGLHGLKVRVNKFRKDLQSQGAHLSDAVVRDLSYGVFVLYRWTADMKHEQRNAMTKLATVWKVKRTVRTGTGKTTHRPLLDIAQEFEEKLSSKAKDMVTTSSEQ